MRGELPASDESSLLQKLRDTPYGKSFLGKSLEGAQCVHRLELTQRRKLLPSFMPY